ncbi:MAG: hypothetical protein MUP81_06690 [Dehalococcoidia bacterium]|nr:hypothetical protein [Dehalococcoidia bacterium]
MRFRNPPPFLREEHDEIRQNLVNHNRGLDSDIDRRLALGRHDFSGGVSMKFEDNFTWTQNSFTETEEHTTLEAL